MDSIYDLPALEWPPKGTDENVDYSLNWKEAPELPVDADIAYIPVLDVGNSETIASVSHEIKDKPSNDSENPLTIGTESTWDGDQQTLAFLSGGVAGEYCIACNITTSGGRTYCRKVKMFVIDC